MTHPTDALRLVPVEPTAKMIDAGAKVIREYEDLPQMTDRSSARDFIARNWVGMIWPAMLSAAPASPLPEGGGQCSGISGELSGWQDISTAPRDGSEFQAWWKGTWQPRARFDPEYGSFQLWGRTDFDTEGWEVFEIDGFWQPQPAAPTGDA